MKSLGVFLAIFVFHDVSALVPTDVEDFLYGAGSNTNENFKRPTRHGGPVRDKNAKAYLSESSTALESPGELRSVDKIMKRDARFFVGNGGTFEIALSFKIPFILIPISDILSPLTGSSRLNREDSSKNTFGKTLGFDSSSLIFAGLLGVAGSLLFPGLGRSLGLSKLERSEKGEDIYQMNMVDKLNNYLKLYDIDGEACLNVAICTGAKASRFSVLEGTASPTNKIVDGLLSYSQVRSILDDTRFKRAFDVGLRGGQCEYKFDSCPFTLPMMETMVNHWLGYSLGAK